MQRRILPYAGIFFFTGMVVQTLACLGGVISALLIGAAWPLMFLGLVRFFEVDFEKLWIQIVIPSLAVLAGTAIAFFGDVGSFRPLMWLSPVLAAVVAAATLLLASGRRKRCSLCNARIGRDVSFTCPRCELLVCERKCWVFERSRCALCEQNRVPILPMDGRWWDKRLGPRSVHGHCLLCQASGQDSDLRVCGKCGRPHCRDCWDYLNGQCTRCGWLIDDLPESLQPYIAGPLPDDQNPLGNKKRYG